MEEILHQSIPRRFHFQRVLYIPSGVGFFPINTIIPQIRRGSTVIKSCISQLPQLPRWELREYTTFLLLSASCHMSWIFQTKIGVWCSSFPGLSLTHFQSLTSASSRGVVEFLRSLGPKVEQRLDDSSRYLVSSPREVSGGFSYGQRCYCTGPQGYDGIEKKLRYFANNWLIWLRLRWYNNEIKVANGQIFDI